VVTGVGFATAESDFASVSVTVSETEKKAADATQAVAERHRAVIQELKALGLIESDIVTRRFTVGPQWKRDDHGNRTDFIGFRATHQIKIRVRDRGKVGGVVDASLAAGAQSIDKIEFMPASADSAQKAALESAVRNAGERAEVMAAAAGGRLGSLIELVTEGAVRARGGELRPDVRHVASLSVATAIAPEELVERCVVLGRWELIKE
jgi:uncharacterized protein YggE